MTGRSIASERTLSRPTVTIFTLLCSLIASRVLAVCLGWEPEPLVRVGLFALLALALRLRTRRRKTIGLGRGLGFLLFSVLLSTSILYGSHITITSGAYSALFDEAFIAPFGIRDLLALALNTVSIYVLATAGFLALTERAGEPSHLRIAVEPSLDRISLRPVIALAVVLLVLWLPYLLTYWPGFIFGDSMSSLSQALGWTGLSNHHPVVYTLFIKVCLKIANVLGFGNSVGCAIYSLTQMTFMAACLSYTSCWIATRTGKAVIAPALVALLGLSPYVSAYTVAMWKDPLFSVSLVVVSLLLCDLALLARENRRVGTSWHIAYLVQILIMTFIRSNGVYISLLILCATIALALKYGARPVGRRALAVVGAVTGAAVVAYFLVTGPLYQALGVSSASRAESLGVPLNQMARVAALDGSMSESDRAYMDELLPLELYEETYRPCCTDLLKWDANFNAVALDGRFFVHWLSMLVRNPGTYVDAWIMQTFGWWTINQPDAITNEGNISGGVPRTDRPDDLAPYGIRPRNLLGSDAAQELFPMDEWSIPAGWVVWTLAYLCLCTLASRRIRVTLLALVPSLGLAATLLIASPIWYWARYAFALQLLLPFYGALFLWLRPSKGADGSMVCR